MHGVNPMHLISHHLTNKLENNVFSRIFKHLNVPKSENQRKMAEITSNRDILTIFVQLKQFFHCLQLETVNSEVKLENLIKSSTYMLLYSV